MQAQSLSRLALAMSAAAVLTDCGGSQPPIGTPGAMRPIVGCALVRAASKRAR